jgi:hypothetical protein
MTMFEAALNNFANGTEEMVSRSGGKTIRRGAV